MNAHSNASLQKKRVFSNTRTQSHNSTNVDSEFMIMATGLPWPLLNMANHILALTIQYGKSIKRNLTKYLSSSQNITREAISTRSMSSLHYIDSVLNFPVDYVQSMERAQCIENVPPYTDAFDFQNFESPFQAHRPVYNQFRHGYCSAGLPGSWNDFCKPGA
ncbi:hypothetical protein TNCV_1787371 [Trichonephila clavipes]|nr:hypothetical protein TNCV_1787371 [Trichonephila clavipes]